VSRRGEERPSSFGRVQKKRRSSVGGEGGSKAKTDFRNGRAKKEVIFVCSPGLGEKGNATPAKKKEVFIQEKRSCQVRKKEEKG